MTVILTLVGVLVFFISLLFNKFNFKSSFKLLVMFMFTGFVCDVLLSTLAFSFVSGLYSYH